MGSLLVLLVIIGVVAYQYLKGSVVKALALLISCICAGVAAFGYYELLAGVLIGKDMLVSWAHSLSFLVIFGVVLAVMEAVASQILKKRIELGLMPERVGRVVCGILAGLLLSGFVLSALAMAPLPYKYPYKRFEQSNPNPDKPGRSLLNADGLVAGWFGLMSRGNFSGKKSFAMLHPNHINQAYLNRLNVSNNIEAVTSPEAIKVPAKGAAWPAPENLRDIEGNVVSAKSGCALTIVRIGITSASMEASVSFTAGQLRIVCKPKADDKAGLAGKGTAVYPIGYMKTPDRMQTVNMSKPIVVSRDDLDGSLRYIDFVFEVPANSKPVLAAFKENALVEVPKAVSAENAPQVIPFILASDCTTLAGELEELSSAAIYGLKLSTDRRLLEELSLKIDDVDIFTGSQTPESITPAVLDGGRIIYVRAELKKAREEKEETETADAEDAEVKADAPVATDITGQETGRMLDLIPRYKLLSLKCNNPATGVVIQGSQLPVLVELSGREHYSAGVIAKGEIDGEDVYEFDFCSVSADDSAEVPEKLTLGEDGNITKPFPENIWITQKAQNISEFYVLYMISTRSNAMITSVRAGDSQAGAKFKKYAGFFVK